MKNYIILLRPLQWLKNLMLLFPPFLGGTLFQQQTLLGILLPFIAFCFISSAVYIINDAADLNFDKQHPTKKFRPLPSGDVSMVSAVMLSVLFIVVAIFFSASISNTFLIFLLLYLLVSTAYSFWLKNLPVCDIFCIASGFLFRLLAGGEAFKIAVSEWLFLSVFLLALFLCTGKRFSEKSSLGSIAAMHRKSLNAYPERFLEGLLFMTGSAVLVTYSMYVISIHSSLLLYTVPLCCFGLLRYILRVQSGRDGDPTESLVKDLPLLTVGILWMFLVGWGIYGR